MFSDATGCTIFFFCFFFDNLVEKMILLIIASKKKKKCEGFPKLKALGSISCNWKLHRKYMYFMKGSALPPSFIFVLIIVLYCPLDQSEF